jgi:hypothetical protein
MQEGFEGADPTKWMLLPCYRPENIIMRGRRSTSGSFSVRLEVRPLDEARLLPYYPSVALDGRSCLGGDDPRAPFVPDRAERAAVWVPRYRRLPVDTELWWGFSMLIAGEVRDDQPRLVIGQWKQSIGHSPILAQRFNSKTFRITIEQDGRNGMACRIFVAHQHGRPKPSENSFLHNGSPAEETPDCISETVVTGPDGSSGPAATLPDPFHGPCWTNMIYHLRASSQNNGSLQPDGLLEVWANGRSVASVYGRIGYYSDDPRMRLLYFKFGPYRDADVGRDYSTTAYLDSFTRGSSYVEVDPARFPGYHHATLCN